MEVRYFSDKNSFTLTEDLLTITNDVLALQFRPVAAMSCPELFNGIAALVTLSPAALSHQLMAVRVYTAPPRFCSTQHRTQFLGTGKKVQGRCIGCVYRVLIQGTGYMYTVHCTAQGTYTGCIYMVQVQCTDTVCSNEYKFRVPVQGKGTGYRYRVQVQCTCTGYRYGVQVQGTGTGYRYRVQVQGTVTENRYRVQVQGTCRGYRYTVQVKGTFPIPSDTFLTTSDTFSTPRVTFLTTNVTF